MKHFQQTAIRLSHTSDKSPISRARKLFNSRSKKLAERRQLLADWNETLPAVAHEASVKLAPLLEEFQKQQRIMLLRLDAIYADKTISKRERSKLEYLIGALAQACLEQNGDTEIKDIYKRRTGRDFDAERAEDDASFRAFAEELFGPLPDEPDPEAEAKMAQQLHDQWAAREASRKKSKRELAKEQREAQEAASLKLSVREIFRKLASELHPDRETDAHEHARKTALMQRVNVAYAANDLLGLLELQLEIEQISQDNLDQLSEERLNRFNKILEKQLRELDWEISHFEAMAEHELHIFSNRGQLKPSQLLGHLHADIARLEADIATVRADIESFQDVAKIKIWLKTFRMPRPEDFEIPF